VRETSLFGEHFRQLNKDPLPFPPSEKVLVPLQSKVVPRMPLFPESTKWFEVFHPPPPLSPNSVIEVFFAQTPVFAALAPLNGAVDSPLKTRVSPPDLCSE